ncbi:MAG: thymidine phosphorylase, partial [Candidatus Nanohaloarchaeota archaeon QJJ-5]|nr:thymidine phosphorylase [Candidatus Nanohaloarchaeota archaeon QJJ-5]
MKLSATDLDMESDAPLALMNRADAEELDVHPLDRLRIQQNGEATIVVVDLTENLVPEGSIGFSESLDISGEVDVALAEKPASLDHIKEKMDGKEWTEDQIYEIVEDIDKNALSDIEMGAYASAVYMEGLSVWESIQLTRAMVDIGDQLQWTTDVVADKHSIGGVPGNRVTPIIIPIIAAKGITIPKTSSRAITSPAGTADTMEAIADVSFSIDKITDIVEETNGCLIWGGAVNLSPVDDKIIEAEYPLSLDPEGQVIASVLSKKRSVGSNHVIIDLPYGKGSKLGDIEAARDLGRKFKIVGGKLGMNIRCTVTRGNQPIGRGIGPALEARDCLKVLKGEGPDDLRIKSVELSNALLDLCGEESDAADVIDSGKALEKFREILEAQNGDPAIE